MMKKYPISYIKLPKEWKCSGKFLKITELYEELWSFSIFYCLIRLTSWKLYPNLVLS